MIPSIEDITASIEALGHLGTACWLVDGKNHHIEVVRVYDRLLFVELRDRVPYKIEEEEYFYYPIDVGTVSENVHWYFEYWLREPGKMMPYIEKDA